MSTIETRTLAEVIEFPRAVQYVEYVPSACNECLGDISRLDDGHVVCDRCGNVYEVAYLR